MLLVHMLEATRIKLAPLRGATSQYEVHISQAGPIAKPRAHATAPRLKNYKISRGRFVRKLARRQARSKKTTTAHSDGDSKPRNPVNIMKMLGAVRKGKPALQGEERAGDQVGMLAPAVCGEGGGNAYVVSTLNAISRGQHDMRGTPWVRPNHATSTPSQNTRAEPTDQEHRAPHSRQCSSSGRRRCLLRMCA